MRRTHALLFLAGCLVLLPGERADSQEGPARDGQAARTDQYGDPLPGGAIARCGTVRWRGDLLGFAAGGRAVVAGLNEELRLLDGRSGRVLRRWNLPAGFAPRALSPDGKTVVLVAEHPAESAARQTVILWDVSAGKARRRIKTGLEWIVSTALSPDGNVLAVRTFRSSAAHLWDATTGKKLRVLGTYSRLPPTPDNLDANQRGVGNLAFSPDGTRLAAASETGTVCLWEVPGGKRLFQKTEKAGCVRGLAFTPDGRTLAWGDREKAVCLWDVARGEERRRIQGLPRYTDCLAFTRDGKTLVAGYRELKLWDAGTGKAIHRLGGLTLRASAVVPSPDGKTLLVGDGSLIRGWDLATGRERPRAPGLVTSAEEVRFSPDGKALAATGRGMGPHCCVWEAATGKPLRQFVAEAEDQAPVFSPDGKCLAFRKYEGLVLYHLDGGPGEPPRVVQCRAGREDSLHQFADYREAFDSPVAYTADGRAVLALGLEGVLLRWDAATGRLVRRVRVASREAQVAESAFSPDGRLLAVLYGRVGNRPLLPGPGGGVAREPKEDVCEVRVFETATGRAVCRFRQKGVRRARFSGDGRTLLVWSRRRPPGGQGEEGLLSLWEVVTGQERRRLRIGSVDHESVAVCPNCRTLATLEEDGTIRLSAVGTGRTLATLRSDQGTVEALAFSPDGSRVATGGTDTTVLVWKVPGGPAEGRVKALTDGEMGRLWSALSGSDAAAAYEALGTLAGAPGQSVPFVAARVRPAATPPPGRLNRLAADLDSDRFAVRETAMRELDRLGDEAEPVLRRVLAGGPSLEVRRRVERLLEPTRPRYLAPEDLRALRGVELLERVGTPEAVRGLRSLAGGAAGARLTQEAKASLRRLAGRSGSGP